MARADKSPAPPPAGTTVEVGTTMQAAVKMDGRPRPLTRRTHQENQLFSSRYLGSLRYASSKRVSRMPLVGQEEEVERTDTYGFRLPGSSRFLEFQYRHGLYLPLSFALRTTQVLEEALFEEVSEAISHGWLEELQTLLTSGKLSLYSRSEWGSSLFHVRYPSSPEPATRQVCGADARALVARGGQRKPRIYAISVTTRYNRRPGPRV